MGKLLILFSILEDWLSRRFLSSQLKLLASVYADAVPLRRRGYANSLRNTQMVIESQQWVMEVMMWV
jgi:hypothetical protein